MRHWSPVLVWRTVPVLLCGLLLSWPAYADITLGSDARSVGMGGAGLASGDSPDTANLNPASLADTGARFGVQWPSATMHMQGAGYGDAIKLIGNPSLSAADALHMAITLGENTTQLDATASAGVLLPKMDLQATAAIRTELLPNEAFKRWVHGGNQGTPSSDARADLYAGGLATLPSVGLGVHVPLPGMQGRLAVGVRVKPSTAYYSHYIIDGNAVLAGQPLLAAEMGGNNYLSQRSFSADLGFTYTPARMPNARFAVVVNNLLEPKAIAFAAASPDGLFAKQMSPRSISAGVALVGQYSTLAADLVDIGGAYGKAQVRIGGEVRAPGNVLALRGGYNSTTGFTAGLGLGSFGIAISRQTPVMLSQSITF
ncbi:MAG TPA: hypothetical protein VGL77_05410 [Armatimonadota bacterium]|jgi:hypothetical protein